MVLEYVIGWVDEFVVFGDWLLLEDVVYEIGCENEYVVVYEIVCLFVFFDGNVVIGG